MIIKKYQEIELFEDSAERLGHVVNSITIKFQEDASFLIIEGLQIRTKHLFEAIEKIKEIQGIKK